MRSATCAQCVKLRDASTALRREYNLALDALALTSTTDLAFIDRWTELARAFERLRHARRLERIHQKDHDDA
jgi:hypothetical protein